MEDYEKKYKEALGRANAKIETYNHLGNASVVKSICEIFPELKESEDERVRKDLIAFLDDIWHLGKNANLDKWSKADCSDWIAWLKKQREVKHTCRNCQTFQDLHQNCPYSPIYQCTDLTEAHKRLDDETHCEFYLEAQGEQKPTNKNKPKFGVGDWITDGTNTFQVVKIEDEWYIADDGDKVCSGVIDQYYHLWTIQDAKDGDVLATDNGGICIFDGTVEEGKYPFAYCGVTEHGFEFYDGKLPFTHTNVQPATKEQCELLFTKMKEACYEWDVEKKELKKIEQKPAWSEEDERYYDSALWHIKNSCGIEGNVYNWLKSLKEQPHWKPSDGQMKVLKQWLNEHRYDGNSRYIYAVINSLYEQLKSL